MDSLLSIFFLFTLFSSNLFPTFASQQPSYKDHCASIIPESTPKNPTLKPFPLGEQHKGYFTGGERIIDARTSLNRYTFYLQYMQETHTPGLFKIHGTVSFRSTPNSVYVRGNFSFSTKRSSYGQRHLHRSYLTFKLDGFWSESSGKVCLVGKGSGYSRTGNTLDLDAVFKLQNVFNASNVTSLVSGSLESFSTNSDKDDESYFEPISLLVFPKANYNYTLDSFENEFSSGKFSEQGLSSLNLSDSLSFCSYPLSRELRRLQLEYSHECNSSKNCSPISGGSGPLPSLVSLKGIECSSSTNKHRLRALVTFSNISQYWINQDFNPKTILVGEGWWDEKRNTLCVVACRIIGKESSLAGTQVGDCSVRFTLRFSSIWSIKNTNSLVGQIWSRKVANDPGYFKMITVKNYDDGRVGEFQASKYEYTQLDRVKKSCPTNKNVKNHDRLYPDADSQNMRFDMRVTESKRRVAWGYSSPSSVGGKVKVPSNFVNFISNSSSQTEVPDVPIRTSGSLFNISYKISIYSNYTLRDKNSVFNLSSEDVKISAEGIYDSGTGTLCMIGCRDLPSKTPIAGSVDCEILVKFQFPSLDAKGESYIKGSIESTRKKSDPLYFRSLDLSSAAFYRETAQKAVWRMDMEITMVLTSTTLACIFVGLQLFHVKRNPDLLPFISLMMMSILTLGHMIPLVLNFEALLAQNPNNKNFVFGNVGWLEVNEIAVRIITMVAFLLQFRLLQLTWSSRNADESKKGLWVAERKSAYVTLPLYAAGLLIAVMLLKLKNGSTWENVKSYGGFVLDGFLLPQIVMNLFSNIREINVLSCSFYFGTTFVRLLPHAYDLYRAHNYARLGDAHNYARLGDGSYYYADPSADFYSTSWDIVIPLGGILFAIIIYLQQRFGAHCVLPSRFRGSNVYEKVPVVTESEL